MNFSVIKHYIDLLTGAIMVTKIIILIITCFFCTLSLYSQEEEAEFTSPHNKHFLNEHSGAIDSFTEAIESGFVSISTNSGNLGW